MICTHQTVGADPNVVTFHECHHVYKRGDKELDSVTRVVYSCFPKPPRFKDAPPEILENARLRGVEVDRLVTAYLCGSLRSIPVGTRRDAKDLFFKLKPWLDAFGKRILPQTILADENIAGTADMVTEDGMILDLKTTYNCDEPTYALQLGMYSLLFEAQFKEKPRGIAIVHLTERFDSPKVVSLDLKQCSVDAAAIRDVWLMAQRRMKK